MTDDRHPLLDVHDDRAQQARPPSAVTLALVVVALVVAGYLAGYALTYAATVTP